MGEKVRGGAWERMQSKSCGIGAGHAKKEVMLKKTRNLGYSSVCKGMMVTATATKKIQNQQAGDGLLNEQS